MKNNRGFSLIELIVVIAIMTILAGMIIGYTGAVGSRRVNKCTSLMDGAMKKARVDTMTKSDTCGVRFYQEDGIYYADIVGEEVKNGAIEYKTREKVNLGQAGDITITLCNALGTDKEVLADNDENSYILIKYARGTGAVTAIRTGRDSFDRTDRTQIFIDRGEKTKCIEIVPETGKHTVI